MGRVVTNKDHPLGFVSDTFSFKEGGVVPCYECMHKRQEGGPGVITSPLGQWAYPGQVTRIPSNNITMQGVNYPVLGVDNMGYKQMMFPGGQYSFPGTSVTEYPIMQRGGPSQFKDIRKVDQMTGRPVTHKNKKNLVLTPDIYQNYINPAIEAARRFNPDPKDKNFVRNFVAQGLIESAYGTAKSAIHNAEQNPWQIQYYYHPELAGEGGREQSIYNAAHLAAENYKRYKNKPEAYKVQAYNGLTPQMKKDPKYGKHVQSVRDSVLKPSGMFDYIDNYQPAPRVQVMPALKPIKKQGEEEDILTRFTRGVFGFFGKELPKEADGGPVWKIIEDRPMAQGGLIVKPDFDTGVQKSDATNTAAQQSVQNTVAAKQFQSDLRNPRVTEEQFKSKHGISREQYRNRPSNFDVAMNQVWEGAKEPFKFIGADPDLIRENPAEGIPQALTGVLMLELPVGEMLQSGTKKIKTLKNYVSDTPLALPKNNSNLNLEEIRRAYHNNERFLQLEENKLLRKHGFGQRENYITSNVLPSPPSEVYVDPTIFSSIKKIRNRSGLTKEEALQKVTSKDKEVISKMPDLEFETTVLKPTGEIVPYETFSSPFGNSEPPISLGTRDYVNEFNSRLDLLNDIIAKRNKTGIEYKVTGLTEGGRLMFETPSMPGATRIWSVGITPGQWRGQIEDIANTEYFRNIPGLEMRNTSSSVFGDMTPRKGSGAYESINEYLKSLDLGRVKPGFNSQTDFSRSAWENFIKSGRGVGFYGNPSTVYGIMKTTIPIGLAGAAALKQKQQGGMLVKPSFDTGVQRTDATKTRIPQSVKAAVASEEYNRDLTGRSGLSEEDFRTKYNKSRRQARNIPSSSEVITNQLWEGFKQPFKFIGADPDLIRTNPAEGIPQALAGTLMLELPVGEMFQAGKAGLRAAESTTVKPFLNFTKESLDDAKGFLKRRQFIKQLQNERLIGKEFNIDDLNYAARSTDKTNKLTQLALNRNATRYRGVQGEVPAGGIGYNPNTGGEFNMSRPAWGNEISEFENMAKAGVDFNDPISIAKYQATHVPMQQYGYRSGIGDYKHIDALYTSFSPTNYGNYQIRMTVPRDYSKGNYQDWFDRYYNPNNNLQSIGLQKGYTSRDFIPDVSYENPMTLSKLNPSVVGRKGQKMFDVDENFPFINYKNLTPTEQAKFEAYKRKLSQDFNTGWRGQYQQGGEVEPYYISDSKEFRKANKAYRDSLYLYNTGIKDAVSIGIPINPLAPRTDLERRMLLTSRNILASANDENFPASQAAKKSIKTGIEPVGDYNRFNDIQQYLYPAYKKPVRKPVYKPISTEPTRQDSIDAYRVGLANALPQNMNLSTQVDSIWTPYGKMSRADYESTFGKKAAARDLKTKKAKGGNVTWQIIN